MGVRACVWVSVFIASVVLGDVALNSPVKAIYVTWKDLSYGTGISTQLYNISDTGYTHIILSFFANGTAYDSVSVWQGLSVSLKQSVKANLAAKNVKLLAGCKLTQNYGAYTHNATELGTQLGSWATSQYFDGIDLNFQDVQQHFVAPGFSTANQTVNWMVDLINAASIVLGASATITVAAQPPFFGPVGGATNYAGPSGGIVGVYLQTQAVVNAVIVYYFLEDPGCVNSYTRMFVISTQSVCFAGTSVQEIGLAGVPLSKIVVALGLTASDTTANGFVQADNISTYITNAYSNITWNGGVAGWQWNSEVGPTWMQTIYPAATTSTTTVGATTNIASTTSSTTAGITSSTNSATTTSVTTSIATAITTSSTTASATSTTVGATSSTTASATSATVGATSTTVGATSTTVSAASSTAASATSTTVGATSTTVRSTSTTVGATSTITATTVGATTVGATTVGATASTSISSTTKAGVSSTTNGVPHTAHESLFTSFILVVALVFCYML